MLNALLLSRDSKLIGCLQPVCTSVGINLTRCSGVPRVTAMLARCKFYGVIVDGAEPDAATVLSAVRSSSSSQNAISIVISDGSAGVPGGTFTLRKPVAVDLATRTLRAAKGPMLTEFRRYLRHPAQLLVLMTKESGGEFHATSINISHRGLAVQMSALNVSAPTDPVRVRLTLPGVGTCIEMKGKVAWADARGRAGIRWEGISPRDRQQLEGWLAIASRSRVFGTV